MAAHKSEDDLVILQMAFELQNENTELKDTLQSVADNIAVSLQRPLYVAKTAEEFRVEFLKKFEEVKP